jgi:hypothetical protein
MCKQCSADAERIRTFAANDRTAALTGLRDGVQDGVTEALLREQVMEALTEVYGPILPGSAVEDWGRDADAVMALPAVRDLLALRRRVAALIGKYGYVALSDIRAALNPETERP